MRHVNSLTRSKIFKPNLTPRIVCEFSQATQILNGCLQFCCLLLMDFAFPIIFNKCFMFNIDLQVPLHLYLMPSGSYSMGSMVIVSIMLSTLINTLIMISGCPIAFACFQRRVVHQRATVHVLSFDQVNLFEYFLSHNSLVKVGKSDKKLRGEK